jgi:hypothetical protein
MTGYFQPSGIPTGAPPGPGLVMLPQPALPSNSAITLTLSGQLIRDTSGQAMGTDRVIQFNTAPIDLTSTSPSLAPDPESSMMMLPDISGGLTLSFNTVLDPASLDSAAFELHRGDASGPLLPLEVMIDDMMSGFVVAPVLMPKEATAEGETLTLVVKGSVRDLYGISPPADITRTFMVVATPAPEGGAPDAGGATCDGPCSPAGSDGAPMGPADGGARG